jgi:hypothetical protein
MNMRTRSIIQVSARRLTILMNSAVFWVVTPYGSERAQLVTHFCWFLAWLTLQPEEGGDMFLQNVAPHRTIWNYNSASSSNPIVLMFS